MRLDLIQYFLAVFVLPSAAKSHQIVSHTKFMASGIKGVIDTVVSAVESTDDRAAKSGAALLDRLGDKVLGTTAESQVVNAPVIAPDATLTPVTSGRRTIRPDGQDPFRSEPSGDPSKSNPDEPKKA